MVAESAWPVHRPTAMPWYLTGEVLFRAGLVACPYVNWVAAATRAASRIVGPDDVVCSVYPPLTNHIAAYHTAQRTGARLVLDFRDEYLGLSRGLRRRLAGRWQGRLLQRADLVSVATSTVADNFIGQGLPAGRIHLTENGYWETPAGLPPYPTQEPVRIVYIGAESRNPLRCPGAAATRCARTSGANRDRNLRARQSLPSASSAASPGTWNQLWGIPACQSGHRSARWRPRGLSVTGVGAVRLRCARQAV